MLRLDPASGELHIQARRASRAALARQLAAITDGELLVADPGSLDTAGPLTLRWQGRDAQEAWQLLLGPAASHALQCEGLRCRVWLLGGVTAPPVAAASAAPNAAKPRAAPAADPPGLFPSE